MSRLKRDEILLLFDIDNTLTLPRESINNEFEKFLYSEIKPLATLAIVTGADLEKIFEQMNGKKVLNEFKYIFPENGIVHIENGVEIQKSSFSEKFGEDALTELINFILRYIADLKLPFKRGTFIEYRNGMLNVAPTGRQCSKEERTIFHEFDEKHEIRKNMIRTLKEKFSDMDLQFAIGGQISFDIYPTGWDKSFCLTRLPSNAFNEIHFFGDQTKIGGNDYEIYEHPTTIGHHVNNYKETEKILKEMFQIN